MKSTKELLGARIKELRKSCGFSQEHLAEIVGVEPKHISRIEVGSSYPSLNRVELIAKALGRPIKDLFDFIHLESPDIRVENMENMMKGMKEEHQRLVYRIVSVFRE
ncbi:helix-turn-helix transcriptional regulator [Geobacter sp. FeAm09]|uniref:helix-turn-helix domain-containing protein n=1 Tax=Geobacter sp. FeAm09 TaxID=2597769 RepID=UPI0011EE9C15|nr:helix-turn-helix transcriptional regulator [Geobacter sp. FeAm09]QEM69982.1 helix-turn-helix transcriptional regulator [Geobacter sp. FeAm09]